MEKAKSLAGKDLMLWIAGKVVALSKSCNLDISVATVDENTKDDGIWDASGAGNRSWIMSNESVDSADAERTNDMVYDDLFELTVTGEPVDVTFGVPSNKSNEGVPEAGWQKQTMGAAGTYKGKALITSLGRGGSKGDNASVSVSLKGVGALTKV